MPIRNIDNDDHRLRDDDDSKENRSFNLNGRDDRGVLFGIGLGIGLVIFLLFSFMLIAIFAIFLVYGSLLVRVSLMMLLILGVTLLSVFGPSIALRRRFQRIGDLRDLSQEDIICRVGRPTSISSLPKRRVMLQWVRIGYHIALVFDRHGCCEGVYHEFAD